MDSGLSKSNSTASICGPAAPTLGMSVPLYRK